MNEQQIEDAKASAQEINKQLLYLTNQLNLNPLDLSQRILTRYLQKTHRNLHRVQWEIENMSPSE